MKVIVESGVDPKDLRINHRYTDTRKVPPSITKAYKQLVADAQAARDAAGVDFPKDPKVRIKMDFTFTFDDKRADLDGPHKRVQDAVAAGMNFNDNRVDDYHAHRVTDPDNVGIRVVVETIDDVEGVEIEDDDDEWSIAVGDSYADIRRSR